MRDVAQGPLLDLSGLEAWYGESHILHGVDMNVRRGEVVCLLGRNGAGKSTLAKIVAGVQQPDGGTIEWLGQPVSFRDTSAAVAAVIAIVLQELSLIPDLSVAENIFLVDGGAYRGGWWLDRGAIRRRTLALYDRLGWGMPVDPDRKVADLTVAEQQMVEIVRAFSLDARLFVLDEPTATLSPHEVEVLLRTCGLDTEDWVLQSGRERFLWPTGYLNWIVCTKKQ